MEGERGEEKGKIYSWNKTPNGKPDDAFFSLLGLIFSEGEITLLTGNDGLGAPQRILDAIKAKILAEMNELIFGKQLIDISIEEQQRISDLLNTKIIMPR